MSEPLTGIDYFTGSEVPADEIVIVSGNKECKYSVEFAEFAALFTKKYGVHKMSKPPLVLSESSAKVLKSYFDQGVTVE